MIKPTDVLVTGGAGFIGSHLVVRLLAGGRTVACLDNFSRESYQPEIKWQNVAPFRRRRNFTLIQGDLRNQSLLRDIFLKYDFETIVHLAGVAGVRLSVERPLLYDECNIWTTINLLEECRKAPPKRFILASSSSVYGNSGQGPFREEQSVQPISPYGASKAAAELFCQAYHSLYSIPIAVLRFFTVYGPRQRPDMGISKFTKAIAAGEAIQLFGDGASRRDYTYVDDIVDGIERSISVTNSGCCVYNLGSGHPVILTDVISLIEEALGKKATITRVPAQPGDVDATLADISQARRVLGYSPRVSIRQGIPLFVRWYQASSGGGRVANKSIARGLGLA